MTFLKKLKFKNIREYHFCGFPIIQYMKTEEGIKFKLFPKKDKLLIYKVLDKIISYVGDEYKDIFIIRSGLGEAYLLNFYIDDFISKVGAEKACFYVPKLNRQRTWDCYNKLPLFIGELENCNLKYILTQGTYYYKNRKIIVCQPLSIIDDIVKKHRISDRHHIDCLLDYFQLDRKNIKPVQFNIKNEEKDAAIKILQEKNINISNFIFISKEANSTDKLDDIFWKELESKIKKLGYDICYNSKEFNISMAIYIASLSKGIVSLRSGFCEGLSLLSQNIPIHILYQDLITTHLSADRFIKAYTLKQYPFVNPHKIYEYNALNTQYNEIYNNIINTLKQKVTI